MHKIIFSFLLILSLIKTYGQELNAQFVVNADLVNQTNQQIFETLERSLNEFINSQSWSNQDFFPQEKITCSFVLNLSSYNASKFEGTLQIQSQRTIFDSNYDSPLLNFLDKDISFTYQEFQPLFFSPASFESNLVSLISFYAYIIMGINADSLRFKGGDPYFEQAQRIVNLSQQSGALGWKQNDSNRNRFWLSDTMRSNTFREYREALYTYHRKGLDLMTEKPSEAKKNIISALLPLENLYDRRPNAMLLQMFFDAKADEIVNLFSDGPEVDFDRASKMLKKIAPFYQPQWKQIK
ncbi:MAG: DUF4835 family protein [Flavobacteriaceae bacterium]|jgi:hypothetical protein|nr:DUF4835 family protein [Flavobacteriaceae bacterium]MBT6127987.1 DUF4835 family protein [Flavobacteriaceae bacterium]MDG1028778.1 DUF4835 family protein [Flavobacteriaceae bacterium]MDG1941234.1 DUF4835 family protein [Flavobacteriaceae bacterium]